MSAPRTALQRARWPLGAVAVSAVVITAELLSAPVRGGTGRSLWLGVGAALLVGVCALLGLRKRLLRLRLGSIAGWTLAHNALGLVALAMALAHCQFQAGGLLTGVLLVTLSLTVASGMVGAVLQAVVPVMMTSRLPNEARSADFERLLVGYWRQAHDAVVNVCGKQPEPAARLLRAERAVHIDRPVPRVDRERPSRAPRERGSDALGRQELEAFYTTRLAAFLSAPSMSDPLASPSEATLAFVALRGHVDARLYALIDDLEAICEQARIRMQERRLTQLMFGWQLLHIPLSTLTLLLLVAHAVAAVYY